MKKAFTLVELIVVIGILAVLSGILLTTFGSSREAALSARCLSNMKSLANAASSYAMANGYYPVAQSEETTKADISKGMAKAKLVYYERPGWISWYSKDQYDEKHMAESSKKSSCKSVSMYSSKYEEVQYAFQNGGLSPYTSDNNSIYVCPLHKQKRASANWSYFMNPKVSSAKYGEKISVDGRSVGADRLLLFAEIPFQGLGRWFPDGEDGTEETDAIIQYGKENIGCNHKNNKYWAAHVVFCDGHVEKLRASCRYGSASNDNLLDVTKWLCEGYDVTFANGAFEKVAGVDNANKTE